MLTKRSSPPSADEPILLRQVQDYLERRGRGLTECRALQEAWDTFYKLYTQKIRSYALACGVHDSEIVDCVQEAWRELLIRLPAFHHDPTRGAFSSWLYAVVRSKVANLQRARTRVGRALDVAALQHVVDARPSASSTIESVELHDLVWTRLKSRLSAVTFRVLRLRLIEHKSVPEVASDLHLTNEQVWYRYHRGRRALKSVGAEVVAGRGAQLHREGSKSASLDKTAQGRCGKSVSPFVDLGAVAPYGVCCVDYVFKRLELGRRDLTAEWKIEWNCEDVPKPVLHLRRSAIVAYAEFCGTGDFVNASWPRIVNAAIVAGIAAGIATIISTPSGALPIFRAEFYKHFQGKPSMELGDKIVVALSAQNEANGPWYECKE